MKAVLLLALALFATQAQAAEPKIRFFGEIPFVAAGNFAEFRATMAQTRETARQELLQEFGSLYLPAVMSGADAESAALSLLHVIVTLDSLRGSHVRDANGGIPQALESQLLARFDDLFRQEGLAPEERRAEISRMSDWKTAAGKIQSLNGVERGKLAGDLLARLDYVLYGSYTVVEGGNVILTLTAESYRTGELHAFDASGSLEGAVAALAQQLFRFAQENSRVAWNNPLEGLEWVLPPPALEGTQLPREAELYCAGQNARLPYARELVLAAQGGNFRAGGIPAINGSDIYLVADLQRGTDRIFYFGADLTRDDPRGPVRSGAGFGTIRPQFACVRGAPAEPTRWEQDLYRAYRRAPKARDAIEYLLYRLDAYGSSDRFASRFGSAQEAVRALQQQGLLISEALLARLNTLE